MKAFKMDQVPQLVRFFGHVTMVNDIPGYIL